MFPDMEQHNPAAIAAIDEKGHELSYGQLHEQGKHLADIIPSHSLVFLFCENSFASLMGYVAFLTHKIVPLMLDKDLDKQFIDTLTVTYRPGWYWRPQHKDGPDPAALFRYENYELIPTGLATFPLSEDLALLVSTSGSTGSPRLVRQSMRNIYANALSIASYLKIDQRERAIVNLPMSYVYGLSIINSHLLRGATLLLTTKAVTQREFWQFVTQYSASSLAGVPYTWEMLRRLGFTKMHLPALKTLTQAGGKLAPELHKAFASYARQHNKSFVVMYGAAEATSRMAWLPPERSLDKIGSIGKAIPGGRFIIIDDQGNEIDDYNKAGELVYFGPNVMLGYAESGSDLNKGDECLGRLATGDIARCDEEGYFTIVGRKSRFIKLFGHRIALDELEAIIHSAFPFLEYVCVAEDQRVILYITDEKYSHVIRSFVCKKIQLSPATVKVKIIPVIPRNTAGKILYSKLESPHGLL